MIERVDSFRGRETRFRARSHDNDDAKARVRARAHLEVLELLLTDNKSFLRQYGRDIRKGYSF